MIRNLIILPFALTLCASRCGTPPARSREKIAIILLFDHIDEDALAGFRHLVYASDIPGLSEKLTEDQPEEYNSISFYVYDLALEQQHYLAPVLTFDSTDDDTKRKQSAQTFLDSLDEVKQKEIEDTNRSICRAVADLVHFCNDPSTKYRVIFFSDMAQRSGGGVGVADGPSTTGDFRFVDEHGHGAVGLVDAQAQLKNPNSWIDSSILQQAAQNPAITHKNMEIVFTGRQESFPNDGRCGIAVDQFWTDLFQKKMGLKIIRDKTMQFDTYDPFY